MVEIEPLSDTNVFEICLLLLLVEAAIWYKRCHGNSVKPGKGLLLLFLLSAMLVAKEALGVEIVISVLSVLELYFLHFLLGLVPRKSSDGKHGKIRKGLLFVALLPLIAITALAFLSVSGLLHSSVFAHLVLGVAILWPIRYLFVRRKTEKLWRLLLIALLLLTATDSIILNKMYYQVTGKVVEIRVSMLRGEVTTLDEFTPSPAAQVNYRCREFAADFDCKFITSAQEWHGPYVLAPHCILGCAKDFDTESVCPDNGGEWGPSCVVVR